MTAAAVGTCTPQQEGLSYPTYLKSCSINEATGRYVTLQVIGRGWLRVHGVEIWGSSGGSGGGDTDPPTVPDNVAGSASSSTAIALSWDASTDVGGGEVAGYKVYRDGVLAGTSTTTGFTDTGLSPATSYAYTVSAYDDADPQNESNPSSPAVNVVTDTPSGNPERLSIVVDSVGASSNRKDLLIDELANGSQNLGTNWNNVMLRNIGLYFSNFFSPGFVFLFWTHFCQNIT